MLAAQFSFLAHELQKFFFGQHLNKNFFQGTCSFYCIIIIEDANLLINSLYQFIWIYHVIAGNIPFMCKKVLIRKSNNGEFRNADVHIIAYYFNGFVHILHAEVLTYQT